MRFSEELRQQADPIFEGIFSHPFVIGIAKGDVPKEALIQYVKADYEYLTAFSKVYGLAMSTCETREDIAFFQQQINLTLNGESIAHENLCRVAGVDYTQLKNGSLPPSAHHYIAHLTATAQSGTLGEIIASLLPCPWTYLEIGLRISGKIKPSPAHPFYDWIKFYADFRIAESTGKLKSILDTWAETASESDRWRAKEAFLKSVQLEYMFWEMAYFGEKWPFENKEEGVIL